MTSPTDAFVLADRAVGSVIAQIRPDQWATVLPPSFERRGRPGEPVLLREVVAYIARDEAWIPDSFAGRTMQEVGPERFEGDLLGADPAVAFAALSALAVVAAEALTDLDRVIHWSYGSYPAAEAIWHPTSFRCLRAVDLARVIGVDDTLDPELVAAMWEKFATSAESYRAIGVFPPAVTVLESAPLQERLLGLLGRQPRR